MNKKKLLYTSMAAMTLTAFTAVAFAEEKTMETEPPVISSEILPEETVEEQDIQNGNADQEKTDEVDKSVVKEEEAEVYTDLNPQLIDVRINVEVTEATQNKGEIITIFAEYEVDEYSAPYIIRYDFVNQKTGERISGAPLSFQTLKSSSGPYLRTSQKEYQYNSGFNLFYDTGTSALNLESGDYVLEMEYQEKQMKFVGKSNVFTIKSGDTSSDQAGGDITIRLVAEDGKLIDTRVIKNLKVGDEAQATLEEKIEKDGKIYEIVDKSETNFSKSVIDEPQTFDVVYKEVTDTNGNNDTNGDNNTNGNDDTNGDNNTNGNNDTNGDNNTNGNDDTNGDNNTNGNNDTNGDNNTNGNDDTNGDNNTNGNNDINGDNNTNGDNDTNGGNNTNGNNDTNGDKDTNGNNDTNGGNNTNGNNDTNGNHQDNNLFNKVKKRFLPQTGEAVSLLGFIGVGLAAVGLLGLKRRK